MIFDIQNYLTFHLPSGFIKYKLQSSSIWDENCGVWFYKDGSLGRIYVCLRKEKKEYAVCSNNTLLDYSFYYDDLLEAMNSIIEREKNEK